MGSKMVRILLEGLSKFSEKNNGGKKMEHDKEENKVNPMATAVAIVCAILGTIFMALFCVIYIDGAEFVAFHLVLGIVFFVLAFVIFLIAKLKQANAVE